MNHAHTPQNIFPMLTRIQHSILLQEWTFTQILIEFQVPTVSVHGCWSVGRRRRLDWNASDVVCVVNGTAPRRTWFVTCEYTLERSLISVPRAEPRSRSQVISVPTSGNTRERSPIRVLCVIRRILISLDWGITRSSTRYSINDVSAIYSICRPLPATHGREALFV